VQHRFNTFLSRFRGLEEHSNTALINLLAYFLETEKRQQLSQITLMKGKEMKVRLYLLAWPAPRPSLG
jgi:hypothetical protein